MVTYNNKPKLGTESFSTSMRYFDESMQKAINRIEAREKDYNINIEKVIINSVYHQKESTSNYSIEMQNVFIFYTLSKDHKNEI